MTEERNQRKVYQGRVVSDKMDKTIYRCRRNKEKPPYLRQTHELF